MDNATHSLLGLSLARSGLNRFCPRATLLLILSSNAPDLDILGVRGGALRYLEWHRGYTHSLAGLPVMAALCVLVAAAIYREKLPWLRAWILSGIGVATHLLLDLTNTYGVRLLLPFSSRWFHLDLNSLYDLSILAVLLFAAFWPHFARLVSREVGDRPSTGRGTAIFAMLFFALFDCGRALLHARAVAQLQSLLYENLPPLETAALPNSFNPFQWTGIVETWKDYRVMQVNTLGNIDSDSAEVFYKPQVGPGIKHAEATEPFRYFLYFSRFPVWADEPVQLDRGQGRRLDLTDLRFGAPGVGSFHCIALEDGGARVLGSWFTYGSGSDLGGGRGQGR